MLKNRSALALALWGAIGFASGGAIGGTVWVAYDAPYIGFAILGAFGGAWFGVILKGWKSAWKLALISAIGFDIGFMIALFIPFAVQIPTTGQGFFIGAIAGALGGGAVGVAFRRWRWAGLLALVSAIGFGLRAAGCSSVTSALVIQYSIFVRSLDRYCTWASGSSWSSDGSVCSGFPASVSGSLLTTTLAGRTRRSFRR